MQYKLAVLTYYYTIFRSTIVRMNLSLCLQIQSLMGGVGCYDEEDEPLGDDEEDDDDKDKVN